MTLAQAKPAIDLTRFQWKRDIGDLTIFGTWLYNEDQEDTEPALVIIPRYRVRGIKPCCIALSAAFRYNEPRYMAWASAHFCKTLGFEECSTNAMKIANVINEHLQDLIEMPNDPTVAVVIGEGTINEGNGKKLTVEILDHDQAR